MAASFEDYNFDKPVFIIGAARSGTTMLGEILSQHPQLAYWLEPKYIWRYGNPQPYHDIREGSEAIPKVVKYIRSRFFKFLMKKGNDKRLLEKTPSNSFRVSFIDKVFPEARFIHIVRDGRDVALSAAIKWVAPPHGPSLMRRLKFDEIPSLELPYYVFRAFRDTFIRFFSHKKGMVWGPYFKGMTHYRSSHTLMQTCAMQWKESIMAESTSLNKLDQNKIITVRYENILSNPKQELNKILDFIELEDEGIVDYALKNINSRKNKSYTEAQLRDLAEIKDIVEEPLKKWDYI